MQPMAIAQNDALQIINALIDDLRARPEQVAPRQVIGAINPVGNVSITGGSFTAENIVGLDNTVVVGGRDGEHFDEVIGAQFGGNPEQQRRESARRAAADIVQVLEQIRDAAASDTKPDQTLWRKLGDVTTSSSAIATTVMTVAQLAGWA